MDDQLLFSDNTDDDRAQGDGSSSSIVSDDDNWQVPATSPSDLITSSRTSLLSNEDIDRCVYVTNIDWRRRFSIRLSNGQLDALPYQERRKLFSACSSSSNYDLNSNRSSSWLNSRPCSLFETNHPYVPLAFRRHRHYLDEQKSITAYARLKRFTERLLELERKARGTVFDKKCDQPLISPKLVKKSFSINEQRRLSTKNDVESTVFNVKQTRSIPVANSKAKLRRIRSSPLLNCSSLTTKSLRRVQTMSAIRVCSIDSPSSSELPPSESSLLTSSTMTNRTNNTDEKLFSPTKEKQITFEVKTNSYNRKIEVKTKQEETICTTKKDTTLPTVICVTTTQPSSSAPRRVSVQQQQRRSSISNSSVQSVRVSVSSSPRGNGVEKFRFTPPRTTPSSDPSSPIIEPYSMSTLLKENLVEPAVQFEDGDVGETFDRRPLLELISELNRHQIKSPILTDIIPPLDEKELNLRSTTPPSPTNIVPPKQFSPFRPVIVHRKYQAPIGRFEFVDGGGDSSAGRRNSRVSVIRSHTFTTPTVGTSGSNKNSSDVLSIDETTTCLSTPELSCSNPTAAIAPQSSTVVSPTVNIDHGSSSSTSGTSLTGTSLIAPTTSSATIDDKNEAKRKAIAMQMCDTEKSYVEALKNLVTKYYLPMKDKMVISDDLVNDIFYKIPEIHIHHTGFFISLSQKLAQWDNKQTVGDLLLQMFSKATVIETYTSFVNNYKTAQIAIRLCRDSSSFNKFLEQQARDHRGKLTLRDLLIQPVQRIPRYELYIKDFLKCTNVNHPDYQLLLKAQSELHSLAEQIDQVQREVGSAELAAVSSADGSLEVVQDMIENLTDLVRADRYYIRHDVVTLQLPSGVKKDRCIFLFNDLVIITSCKRRSGTLTKKTTGSVILNSPSGKQYIDNAKHKLIMKIPLDGVNLSADHLKKTTTVTSTPPSMVKSHSTASASGEKNRHLEDDAVILGHMNDLAKGITVPHQVTFAHLDESIKDTLHAVNKHLTDETSSTTGIQAVSPESNVNVDHAQQKSSNIQLTINTTERTETIDVLFSSAEHKNTWEKTFLEAKKALFEVATGRRNITFQHVLTLPHSRPGIQFSCAASRFSSSDIWVCNTEGQVCLVNLQPDVTLKACNTVSSSRITCVAYIPAHKGRRTGSSIKHSHQHQHKHQFVAKQQSIELSASTDLPPSVDSLLDIDSSDDEDTSTAINNDDLVSLGEFDQPILFENDLVSEQQDTREATMWLGTSDGGIQIYQCTETMKTVARKSRIVKQLGSAIHSILYNDNKVFVALGHGELCVFRRDMAGRWDLDCPTVRSIEEESTPRSGGNGELDDGDSTDPISVMALVAGKLWCAIRDRIIVVCPNSLIVEHSFAVDDCHRHVACMATGGSSMHHVWIASQGSHEIRLYHATHFACLLETSIRTPVTQKLQMCDDIIRAHKLGCLRVTALHVCKETLWVGTSAGVLINISVPQLIDSSGSGNKLTSNSLQIKALSFGHAGPIRFVISADTTVASTSTTTGEETTTLKTLVLSGGDGFEDYANNDETLGKEDALSHVIVWQL